jgi:hypothetical protein
MQRASATRRISKATSEAEYISGHEKKDVNYQSQDVSKTIYIIEK